MLLDNIKTRGKDVSKTLTLAYLDDLFEKQNKKCAYTGEPLTFRTSTKLGNASLDRIDSSKGYIEGNLQWVHKTINEMKTDLSHDIFVEYCKKVAKKENKNA
jgi:hypothetical protein